MKKIRDDFIRPFIVLCAICLVCTLAVAATFNVTDPEIQRMEIERAREARLAVLPEADEFIQILDIELPSGVIEAFRAGNGAGFVFQAQSRGYAGNVPFMIGLNADGAITGIRMLTNNETVGIGDRIAAPEYLALYYGLTSPDGVDGIAGATVTVNALVNSLRHAAQAFEQLTVYN